jgi:hypothetical protein
MGITKQKFREIDYREFEMRILHNLVPSHIPGEQVIKYLEGKHDRKEKEGTNQYSEQESESTRITEVCGTKNI